MIDERFVILGAVFSLIGSSSYVVATLRGKTQPNRVAWSLWALAPFVAFAAQLGEGVGLTSLMTFMVGFGPLMILIASFVNKQAYWKATRFDYVCGAVSLAALGLWALTRTGDVAIALSLAADFMAGIPIIVKAYQHPETESPWVFLLAGVNATIAMLTIDEWTFAAVSFPLYILVFSIAITLIIVKVHRKPLVVAGAS